MKRTGLLMVVLLLACGAGASSAHAEGGGSGVLLLLESGVTKLEAKLKAGASELVTLAGKALTATGVEIALKGCEDFETSEKDTNSCKGVAVTFTGVKKGEVNCRSENAKGEKDPVGTVLAVAALHLAAEETSSKSLAPLVLIKVLGTSEEEELAINCGVVKNKVKGVLGCLLLPGLTNIPTTTEPELTCKINATTKDPETGTCVTSCGWLTEHPFQANLGAGFEDSWMAISAKGAFNKAVFLDDCAECKEEAIPWTEIKNVAGVPERGAPECNFPAANLTCRLELKNASTRSLRVIETLFFGLKITERYKKNTETSECVFNLPLGECRDEFELLKFEAGGMNNYCFLVEDKGTKEKQQNCATLKM